jgi:hypothetical protein
MIPAFISSLQPWVIIFWIVAYVAVIVSAGWLFSSRLDLDKTERLRVSAVLAATSSLGVVMGFTSGMSRDPVVDAVAPAFIGLVGGLSVYVFSLEKKGSITVGMGVAVMILSLLVGIVWGATQRNFVEKRQICFEAAVDLGESFSTDPRYSWCSDFED